AASTNPYLMLECRGKKLSARKLRLFAVGCCRRVWTPIEQRSHGSTIELAERAADGGLTTSGWRRTRSATLPGMPPTSDMTCADWAVQWLLHDDPVRAATYCSEAAAYLAVPGITNTESLSPSERDGVETELRAQAMLLRCVAGYSPRPPRYRTWLTSTVVALARGIYEERAFDRMPILADALQDAGCDNEDIL